MQFELFIGARYLRAKQKQAFISLITLLSIAGVTLGVMALIIVIAVMAGFESDLKSRILSVESHIVVMRHGGSFTDYAKVNDWVNSVEGVEASTPFILSQIMIRSASGMSGAVIRGIVPESAGKVISSIGQDGLKALTPHSTAKPSATDVPGVVLGKELMKSLGVAKGDLIHILSPRGMISPAGLIPVMKRFQVVGEFESGMYEYDGSLAYMNLSDAQKFLHMEDAITGIEVRVNDIYKARKISETITSRLGFPYWSRDWMQMNRNLFSALKLEKTVMFIILALIILVAAFNIASSLIMMVMEKTKDIAILKAMGATDRSIRRIFVFKGMTIGVIGTTLGVSLGFALCKLLEHYKFIELPGDVYYITKLPVLLKTFDVVSIAAASLIICFIATLYPARQASKLNPVEAIRYG
ncbi:MAG: lipoprotein-releasing ABC transporter permease subunit [Deltaproteobacteria bacterium]|nr:lipoprotein-releasing ABC transporter permease subunit [Deltaproteobacteria bacterium]